MSWAGRRQLLYIGVASLIVIGAGGFVAYSVLATPPICFDGKQNGGEGGPDCGGPCSKLCPNQALQPVVLWTRAFKTSPGIYAAAAYVENNNTGAGAKAVTYAFRLYDADNLLVAEKGGVMDIPPQEVVPVFASNIDVGTREVARAFLEFSEVPVWNRIPSDALPNVRISNLQLGEGGSRLSAEVVNQGSGDVRDLSLTAVLFDANGTAVNASKSTLDRIPRGASQEIVFTWPAQGATVVRAEITPVPSL